jgi:hypothetical protein
MRVMLTIISGLLFAGCTTPLELCVSRVTKDLRIINSLDL